MNNDQKKQFILKTIRSCKTTEQLNSCKFWINNLKYKDENQFASGFILKLDLLTEVKEMLQHFKRLEK